MALAFTLAITPAFTHLPLNCRFSHLPLCRSAPNKLLWNAISTTLSQITVWSTLVIWTNNIETTKNWGFYCSARFKIWSKYGIIPIFKQQLNNARGLADPDTVTIRAAINWSGGATILGLEPWQKMISVYTSVNVILVCKSCHSTPRGAYSTASILVLGTYCTHFHYCSTKYSFTDEWSEAHKREVPQPFQAWIYHCHLHSLQAANCCRNSRLVVDEDDLR